LEQNDMTIIRKCPLCGKKIYMHVIKFDIKITTRKGNSIFHLKNNETAFCKLCIIIFYLRIKMRVKEILIN
jgi:hypothetical protein